MKIVLGLGNFGDKYAYTYHNLGFLAAECLAERLGFSFSKRDCESLIAKGIAFERELVIAKPLTYMNLSGSAAAQLLKKFKAAPSDLLVIYDDIDIERGTVRVRMKGSAGTHNGMRHIISVLKTEEIPRIRIGAGRPEPGADLAEYVLSQIPKKDRQVFYDAIGTAADEAAKVLQSTDS